MYRFRNYILLLVVGTAFFSCSKKDFEADIPSYLAIDKFTLTTDPLTQGTNSHNITDAWVFIDDKMVGVFELPCNVPILQTGDVEIKVFAGIKENGIRASRTRYLFYTGHVERVTLVPNETLKINPEISYTSATKFAWMEDFENAGLSFDYTTDHDTVINIVSDNVFEGIGSGEVFLTVDMDFFEAKNTPAVPSADLRNGTVAAFLELNFRTNEPILVGLVDSDGVQAPLVNLNIATEWTKIYINLTEAINANPNSSSFQVFFGIRDVVGREFIAANPHFFLDNIKLVHL